MRMRSGVLRFVGGFGGALLLSLVTPITGLGGYWLAGSAPTGGNILHETALTPPEPSRTTIGIGEAVNLQLESYYDMDIWVDDQDNRYEYEDPVGDIEWSMSGPGTLASNRGAANWYTAPIGDSDTCVSIQVALHDSGDRYVDPVVCDGVAFDILVPDGVTSVFWADSPIGTDAPPINSMGAYSLFAFQTLPDTVNFAAAFFREDIPAQAFTWPDGTQYARSAFTQTFTVMDMNGTPNWQGDYVSTGGPWSLDHLQIPGSDPPAYQGCQFDIVQYLQFYSGSGWVTYAIVTHPSNFSPTTFATQVGWGGIWGGPQGPYLDYGY